jgi:uncharacterized protein (TIGR02271 family)
METTGRYNEDAPTGEDTWREDMRTIVAAAFAERQRAHDAVHRLHDEGFRDTWIGITRVDDADGYGSTLDAPTTPAAQTRVESENWFMRFFGEGNESLYEALVRRGVRQSDARAAGTFPDHSAILTVDGANHPELAVQIISECGGELITRGFGTAGYGTAGMYGSALSSDPYETSDRPNGNSAYEVPAAGATTGDLSLADTAIEDRNAADRYAAVAQEPLEGASAYDDYGRFRAGEPVDESTRLQLREERLRVDKSRISRGEATVGTEVVTEMHNIDVPIVREELFIDRRPANRSAVTGPTPISDERDVIRIPLVEEEVQVTKTPVVVEEVVVGKRQVEDTQRISETTRKEQLNVNDVDPRAGTGQTRSEQF